jgi:hypothetical protein
MCLVNEILRISPVVPLLQSLTNGRPEVLENHLWTPRDSDDGQVYVFLGNKENVYQLLQ